MKLKTFSDVNICNRTQFDVFTKEKAGNEYIESFTVDYRQCVTPEGREKLLKRLDYEKRGAAVRYVSWNYAADCLDVTIEI